MPAPGLGVGAVGREDEVVPEFLAVVVRAHSPGQIGAPGHCSLPLTGDRLEQVFVPGLDRDVDRRRRQVERPDRMTGEGRLVPDRHVVLEIGAAPMDVGQGLVPASLQEERSLMQVTLLTGEPGQFHQPELDLGMSPHPLDAAGTECLADVVGGSSRHIDEEVVLPGPGPGQGSLEHVAVAVQLVAPLQVAVARGLTGTPEHGVEIAVVLLHRSDHLGQGGESVFGVGGAGSARLPGGRLHQLVHVGIGEHHASAVFGQPPLDRGAEVADPAQPFHPVVAVGDGGGRVHLLALGPEPSGYLHLGKTEGAERSRARHHRATVELPAHATWSCQVCSGW